MDTTILPHPGEVAGFMASRELYDPLTDEWHSTAKLATTHSAHTR